jgi:hypothetical protein
VKPIISEDFLCRGQVDLIDMQSSSDGPWNWIMNYQDHHTKFCVQRALTQKCAKDVAANLIEIFLTFSAPGLLQSDNGREFVNKVIDEMKLLWPNLKITNGRARHPQSQGSIEQSNQCVENMLASWCSDNKTTKWASGLMFIQYSKNTSHHRGIGMSPFKAMFGCVEKLGMSTKLPKEILDTIRYEEDLLEKLRQINSFEYARTLLVIQNNYSTTEDSDQAIPTIVQQIPIPVEEPNIHVDQQLSNNTEQQQQQPEASNDSSTDDKSSRASTIVSARQVALKNKKRQADEMLLRSRHKCPPHVVSSTVQSPIPEVEQEPWDPYHVLCFVVEIKNKHVYIN